MGLNDSQIDKDKGGDGDVCGVVCFFMYLFLWGLGLVQHNRSFLCNLLTC